MAKLNSGTLGYDWTPVFLVGEGEDGEFQVIEAKGVLIPPDEKFWKIRRGCFLDTVPEEKVYLSRVMAEHRMDDLKKEREKSRG